MPRARAGCSSRSPGRRCSTRRSNSVAPRRRVEVEGDVALFALACRKNALNSHHSSRSANAPPVIRMPSSRWIDSTWMTSAPSAAKRPLADGPAHHAVRSTTAKPVRAAGRADRRGAAPSGGRGPSVRRRARRSRGDGTRGRRGLAVDRPRTARHPERAGRVVDEHAARVDVLELEHAGPSETGATGMRRSAACSTMTAVGCRVVHACTIAFHSSRRVLRVR